MSNILSVLIKYLASFLGVFLLTTIALDAVLQRDYSLSMFNMARDFVGKPQLRVAYPVCVKQPIEGSTFVFDYPALHSENNQMVQLELSNWIRAKSVLVHLYAPDDPSRRIVSSLIPAMGSVTVDVPSGKYNVKFEQGQFFCNLEKGFLGNSKTVRMRQLLDIESMSHATFKIEDGAISNNGLNISLNETKSEMNLVSTKNETAHMTIPKSLDGHFYVSGEGNKFPVVFLVDTGATNVSFPLHLIKNLGVKRCTPITSNTANGIARGCMATIDQLTLGPFTVRNIKANFLPKLNKPLLGMSVLNQFSMYHVDDVLQIAPKSR
jgi:clan AA aspartic protease (TIGR02281 family)